MKRIIGQEKILGSFTKKPLSFELTTIQSYYRLNKFSYIQVLGSFFKKLTLFAKKLQPKVRNEKDVKPQKHENMDAKIPEFAYCLIGLPDLN